MVHVSVKHMRDSLSKVHKVTDFIYHHLVKLSQKAWIGFLGSADSIKLSFCENVYLCSEEKKHYNPSY